MNCLDSILSHEIPCSRSRPAHIIPCITMVAVVFKAAGPHTHRKHTKCKCRSNNHEPTDWRHSDSESLKQRKPTILIIG